MRVAIIHEWLASYAGSERVVAALLDLYPDADVFAVVDMLPTDARHFLRGKTVTTTFIQNLPFSRRAFRHYLPLMPLAIEQLDLSNYDVILSSSHAVAKGVLTCVDQLHISYCHTPLRYAWDLQHQYLASTPRLVRPLVRLVLHQLRGWDYRSAQQVDIFVANSDFIRRRIAKTWRRDAEVIYPPVDLAAFPLHRTKSDFYVAASRLVPYKAVPVIAEAFAAMPERRLVVAGSGPDLKRVQEIARQAPNIEVLGYVSDTRLRELLQQARALVFAAEEDFGILPVEAQACGTPVIALGRGGALETVRNFPTHGRDSTGVFFPDQTAATIPTAVAAFEAIPDGISPEACASNAARFGPKVFATQFRSLVADALARRQEAGHQILQHSSSSGQPRSPAAF